MATSRPRPQVMRLSEAAAGRIKELMDQAERPLDRVVTQLRKLTVRP